MLQLLVVLVVLALIWYLIESYVPSSPFKVVAQVVIVLVLIVWLLSFAGLMGPMPFPLRR